MQWRSPSAPFGSFKRRIGKSASAFTAVRAFAGCTFLARSSAGMGRASAALRDKATGAGAGFILVRGPSK
jgi:hypothetical protein